jgi:parallel beta-helix repeat protein
MGDNSPARQLPGFLTAWWPRGRARYQAGQGLSNLVASHPMPYLTTPSGPDMVKASLRVLPALRRRGRDYDGKKVATLGGKKMTGQLFLRIAWAATALPILAAMGFQEPEKPPADAVVPVVTDIRSLLNASLSWQEAGQLMIVDRLNIQYYLAGTDITIFPVWVVVPPIELQTAQGTWREVESATELDPNQENLVLRVRVRNLWADSEYAGPAVETLVRERLSRRHGIAAEALRFFNPKIRLPIRAVARVPLEGSGEPRVSAYAQVTQQYLESAQAVPLRIALDREALAQATAVLGRPVQVGDLRLQFEVDVYSRLETQLIEARLDALQASLAHLREQLKTQPGEVVSWLIAPAGGQGEGRTLFRQVLEESLSLQISIREGVDVAVAPLAEHLLQHAFRELRRGQIQDGDRVALLFGERLALVGTMGEITRLAKLDRKEREQFCQKLQEKLKNRESNFGLESGLNLASLSTLGLQAELKGGQRSLTADRDFAETLNRVLEEVGEFWEGRIPALPALNLQAEAVDQAFRTLRGSIAQSRFTAAYYPIASPLLELGVGVAVPRSQELAYRILRAEPGATIQIEAGEFRIDQPLVIRHSLTLVGKGRGETILLRGTKEPLFQLEGEAMLTLRDLTVRQAAETGTPLISANAGLLVLQNVQLSGTWGVHEIEREISKAMKTAAEKKTGETEEKVVELSSARFGNSAVLLGGSAKAEITGCEIGSFSGAGVLLGETASAWMQHVKVRDCYTGVHARGDSTGRATTCTFEANWTGAMLSDDSIFQLLGCFAKENRTHGIQISGASSALVSGCSCENNGSRGIHVGESARPTLHNNICRGNKGTGIYYGGMSGGTARENTCESNGAGWHWSRRLREADT